MLICRINTRSPAAICGRPPGERDLRANSSESQIGASG
jgi:hypothetical protein